MKDKLTKKEESLIPVVRQEWLDLIHSKEFDKKTAKKEIEWLYNFCGHKKPMVWYFDSPLALQIVANLLKKGLLNDVVKDVGVDHWSNIGSNIRSNIESNIRSNIRSNIGSNIRSNIESNIRSNIRSNIGSNIESNIWSNIRSNIESNIRSNIESNIRSNIRSNIWSNIRSNIWSNIESNIRSNIWSNIESNIRSNNYEFFTFAYYGNVSDYGWMSYVDYFERIKAIEKNKDFQHFKRLLKTGIYDMIQFEGICLVCGLPEYVKQNEATRLHSEDSPAIRFKDGFELYYWNGVDVSEKLIMTPEKITKRDILKETNAEKRRCIYEKLGAERYAKVLGIKQVNRGERGVLYKTKDKDELVEDYLYFVKVVCPTTQRVYFLGTEEKNDADLAVARSFGMSKEEYQPSIES